MPLSHAPLPLNCTSATHTTPTGSFAKFLQTREDAEVKYNKNKREPPLRRWLGGLLETRGSGASFLTTPTATSETDPGHRGLWRVWRGPRAQTWEVESNGGSGEGPARCDIVAANAWQSTSGPNPMLFTPLGGAFGCSGIAAKDPAWRRPSWCGVVHLFVSFSTLGHTEVFSTIIRVWSADRCSGLFRLCCRFVWGGYLWASRGSLSSPRVDDPIQPSELSCCVLRIDVPI